MGKMQLVENANGSVVEGFCVVKSAAVRTDSKGQDYMDLILFDGGGECAAKLWSYNFYTHGEFAADDVVKIRGSLQYWKDTAQIRIERIRKATPGDPVDMTALIPCAPIAPELMFDELYELTGTFHDKELERMVRLLMDENKQALLIAPAAVKLHHATRGGLLHHTLSVVRMAKGIAALYPRLDGDLIYAGAILDDIGKLTELCVGSLGLASSYTTPGQLLGHIDIGITVTADAAKRVNMDPETTMLIQHMLLSHHGTAEHGSAKPPMFPEAAVLSFCDDLDSTLFEMFDALDGVASGGFSERLWALDNRQLYRHTHKDVNID